MPDSVGKFDIDTLAGRGLERGGKLFQKRDPFLLKARIGSRPSHDELRQLREGRREHRQRPHGQHYVAGIEFAGDQAVRLSLPDALQPDRHRRQPLLFVDDLVAVILQGLPFQQTDPVGLAGGLKPKGQAFGGIPG